MTAVVRTMNLPTGFGDKFTSLWRYYLMYCRNGSKRRGINVAKVMLQR
jgi:cyclopropane fatty-acyl-phospholipid synthase-like methyltransferase